MSLRINLFVFGFKNAARPFRNIFTSRVVSKKIKNVLIQKAKKIFIFEIRFLFDSIENGWNHETITIRKFEK